MALLVPFVTGNPERGPNVLVIVLEPHNLERMRQGDPFDVHLGAVSLLRGSIADLDIVIAYEEDRETLLRFQAAGDINGLLAWIDRGRTHRDGDGEPPVSVAR